MKKILSLLVLIFLGIFLTSCTTVSSGAEFEILNVYYKTTATTIKEINENETISLNDTFDHKLYFNLNAILSASSNKKVPTPYLNSTVIYYDLYLNDEFIGTVGNKLNNPEELSWKSEEDGTKLIDEVYNASINLAKEGNYKLIFYFDYNIGEENYYSSLEVNFSVIA